jgi:hypothetical protein
MIEILPKSHGNILGVKAIGKVTAEDYEKILIPKFDNMLAEHEKGKFIYYLCPEFEGFEMGAVWDDAKYACGHQDRFEKIALVGGPKWMSWTTKIAGAFISGEIRTFDEGQLQEAWDWIEEDTSSMPSCDASGTSEHARPSSEDEPCKE